MGRVERLVHIMFAIIVLLSCVGAMRAQALATPKPEPVVSDTIRFYYDPATHYFVGVAISNCFMVPLSRDEQDHIHSNQGIEDLELAMMREWLGTLSETRVYHDDPTLPAAVSGWCKGRDIFLLARNLGVTTTAKSPLGRK